MRDAGRKYRVAIVTSIHPDFDQRLWKHAQSLVRLGYSVTMVCPWDLGDGETRDGVEFRPFRRAQNRKERLLIPLRLFRRLRPLLSRLDIVHFHDLDLLPWMALLSLRGKHVVYDVHENYPLEIREKYWIPRPLRLLLAFAVRWMQLLCARIVRNVVLVAHSQEKDIFGRHLRRVYVRNYASKALLARVEDNYLARPDAVVFTGTQNPNNGSLLLLDIAERIRVTHPGLIFYTTQRFDEGSAFRAQMLNEIEKRHLTQTIQMLPRVRPSEMMSVLNRATVALSPNLRVPQQINGVHTKLFEYMAAALPSVVSDLPHQVEVIEGNDAGLLAQPEKPETFVQAILRLLEDKQLAVRLGQKGQLAFLRDYSWESQDSVYRSFYDSIMGSRPSTDSTQVEHASLPSVGAVASHPE